MQIIQLHSMGGCGTHLILDLFYSVGIKKLNDPVLLLHAMFLARNEAQGLCRIQMDAYTKFARTVDYSKLTTLQALELLAEKLNVTLPSDLSSDEECFECFFNALKGSNHERMVIGHYYYFSHALRFRIPNGRELVWTVEDRDNAQATLERAMAYLAIDYRQVAVLRNPVDIYLSNVERLIERGTGSKEPGDSREDIFKQEIDEFFLLIAEKAKSPSFPVVLYEEICRPQGNDLHRSLAKLHFSPTDIERVNKSLIHSGNLEKWRLYPSSKVSALAKSFNGYMEPFGYEPPRRNRLADVLVRPFYLFRKYRVEFRVINRLAAGDFSIDSAFSRHDRSIPARLWFRFRVLFPGARENVKLFYRTRKNAPDITFRPMGAVLREFLRGLLK